MNGLALLLQAWRQEMLDVRIGPQRASLTDMFTYVGLCGGHAVSKGKLS